MIQAWKIKREILRGFIKVYDFFHYPLERLQQTRYDKNFYKTTRVTEGLAPQTQKFAVFLVFQPNGMAKSILVTCDYLNSIGYSTLLVSSAPISDLDRPALVSRCWKIVERPNYGYDFGGYRDGIFVMQESGVDPENLIIMNDSIWFPLAQDNRMIGRLEAEDLQFVGPIFQNRSERKTKHQHFQSYFLLLKSEAIKSYAFQNYWRNYKISDKKRIVLLRGEKGFSQAMIRSGISGILPSTRMKLLEQIKRQTNDFLRLTLSYAAYEEQKMAESARNLLTTYADTDDWRQDALLHMKKALNSTQPMGVFCYACIKLLDFSFLKKSSYPAVHDGMRWQYLRAVRNGDLPAPHPDILAEIMASKMDGRFTTAPSLPAPVSATKAL